MQDYTHNNIAHRFWSVKGGCSAGLGQRGCRWDGQQLSSSGAQGDSCNCLTTCQPYRKSPSSHNAGATGGGPALEALLRAFSLLAPDQFNTFSAARYETDHHIAPHDDRAYTPVQLDTGGCSGPADFF